MFKKVFKLAATAIACFFLCMGCGYDDGEYRPVYPVTLTMVRGGNPEMGSVIHYPINLQGTNLCLSKDSLEEMNENDQDNLLVLRFKALEDRSAQGGWGMGKFIANGDENLQIIYNNPTPGPVKDEEFTIQAGTIGDFFEKLGGRQPIISTPYSLGFEAWYSAQLLGMEIHEKPVEGN